MFGGTRRPVIPPAGDDEAGQRDRHECGEPDPDEFQVRPDVLGVGQGQHEAVEGAECQAQQHPQGEPAPAVGAVVGEPAHQRHQRAEVGDRVDPDDEHQPENEPADEEPAFGKDRRDRGGADGGHPAWQQVPGDQRVDDDRQATEQQQLRRGFAVRRTCDVEFRLHQGERQDGQWSPAGTDEAKRESGERQEREHRQHRVAVQHAGEAVDPTADGEQRGHTGHELGDGVRPLLVEAL